MQPPLKPWTPLQQEYIYEEQWFKLRKDKLLKGSGEEMDRYYTFEFTDWVTVLPITADNKIILVKQYRYALGTFSLEIPGGIMDAHETDPMQAAIRELSEETGYTSNNIVKTATIAPNPATHNNLMHCYVATNCQQTAQQDLDDNEELEIIMVTMDELKALLADNKIIQSLHVSSIFYSLLHLQAIKMS